MSDTAKLRSLLRESAAPEPVAFIERLLDHGSDRALTRINVLDVAARNDIDEDALIAAFLHSARLGLFDLSWNVLCPGCSGVVDAGASLKSIRASAFTCHLCAAGYEPTLDELVEVTFTVNPRVRRVAAHDPDSLSIWEYFRQVFWSSGIELPEEAFDALVHEVTLEALELPAGERAIISLDLPAEFVIVFDPVTHATQFIDVKGDPVRERRSLSLVFDEVHATRETITMAPGPLRIAFENRTRRRVLPALWVAGDTLHHLLGQRRPFLTAKRLLTNQTFRDIYRTDTIDSDQRLKITSLTFMFTDLKGSTALYDRVGDLAAYDLVQAHFQVLHDIVGSEGGAVVKTIGDAVMATFETPDRALVAALRMREALEELAGTRGIGELVLKIGIHEGPCLAVMLNDRQDYFGQTVNIAARVQGLAQSRAIFASHRVVDHPSVANVVAARSLAAVARRVPLEGVGDDMAVYEIS